jgi:ribosomal protein S18 acetylase RimI-like enzyme
MIRPTRPEDSPVLLRITEGTGIFLPHDLTTLKDVLADYHAGTAGHGHRCVTFEHEGNILGFAYFAPSPMADRTWHLWWIVVGKQTQARGIGGQLLQHVEETVQTENGRFLFVETSSLPSYDLTRRFYLKHGYEQDAVLHDFYADGHDMVIFRKRMTRF